MKSKFLLLGISFVLLLVACSKDDLQPKTEKLVLPETPFDYTVDNPWSSPYGVDNTPTNNPTTDLGATLGRVLFHDKRLSKSNRVSCAGCHAQTDGFADDKAFSQGFVNDQTRRNSMSLVNLKSKFNFFWDSRATELESQVLLPITDHIEMGLDDEDELINKLDQIDYYPELFSDAFGDEEITLERVSMAMAQYMRALESFNSKYDKEVFNQFENFSLSEKNGMDLFFNKLHCGQCHNGSDFRGWGHANVGLDLVYEDNGASELSGNGEGGNFVIPTLRNIAVSGPYMHDGRFETLEEVIEHYANGVQNHEWLDFRLRFFASGWSQTIDSPNILNNVQNSEEGDPLKLVLSDEEVADLVNFLETLTDTEMLNDPKYSSPFVYE